jgi:hypothetical protein
VEEILDRVPGIAPRSFFAQAKQRSISNRRSNSIKYLNILKNHNTFHVDKPSRSATWARPTGFAGFNEHLKM